MPYEYGSANQSGTSSGRDTGSNYGQFDRAVSRAVNNPPASTPSGNGDNYQDRIQRIAAEQARAAEQIAQEKSTAEREMRETIAKAEANKKIVNELLNQKGIGSIDVGFQNALRKQQIRKDDIAAQQDPNYGQFFRPQPVVEKPKFFDTGMGKFVKGAGTAMALPMASAFLPKQAVTALTWGKRIKDIKDRKGIYGKALGFMEDKTGKKLGFNNLTSTMDKAKAAKFRDERTTLGKQDIEDWERKQDWSGIKPDVGGGGDGQGQGQGQGQAQAQAPKDVVTASIQKFTPEQADMMKQRHSQLQGVLESGVYQGRQLTAEEIQMLQQKSLEIQKLMEQYLVDPEELGLARGGIADLYRYGGFI